MKEREGIWACFKTKSFRNNGLMNLGLNTAAGEHPAGGALLELLPGSQETQLQLAPVPTTANERPASPQIVPLYVGNGKTEQYCEQIKSKNLNAKSTLLDCTRQKN